MYTVCVVACCAAKNNWIQLTSLANSSVEASDSSMDPDFNIRDSFLSFSFRRLSFSASCSSVSVITSVGVSASASVKLVVLKL